MIIKPKDIAAYAFCPMLYIKGRQDKFLPSLTLFERNLRKSLIKGEETALLKDTIISVKKLIRAWDNEWWPDAMAHKMDMIIAKEKAVKATEKFIDYCNYEVTDYLWPTIGVNIESRVDLGGAMLVANADIIKVNLEEKKRNTVLLNFTKRNLSIRDAAFDNLIKATVYAFYSGKGENITHINININEDLKKIKMNISNFKEKDIDDIRKMIYHVKRGITSNTKYMNPIACEGCAICPEYKH